MTHRDWSEKELLEVWLAACEGTASDEDLARLNEWVVAEEGARQSLAEIAQDQAWLAWNGATADLASWSALALKAAPEGERSPAKASLGDGVDDPQGRPGGVYGPRSDEPAPRHLSHVRPVYALGGAFALGACVALAVTWSALSHMRQARERAASVDARIDATLRPAVHARIVSSTAQCLWDEGSSVRPALGQQLRGGQSLHLLEGIAELSVSVGSSEARMHLEGPVAVVLAADGLPSLRYGKVTVQTDASPLSDSQIETSFGRVLLAPDTDVGVASFGSVADIHVFRGQVSVESPWLQSDNNASATILVNAGESLQVENVGGSTLRAERGVADRAAFTPEVSMSSDFLAVGPEYIRDVIDSSPVVYWRFDSVQDGRVLNEMGDRFHGRVKGTVGWTGPEGNQAIQFGVSPSPGSVVVPGASWDNVLADGFSLEAWIKPSHHHLGSVFGFVGASDRHEDKNTHGVLVEVCGTSQPSSWHQPRRVRFLHRAPLSFDVEDGVSCFSEEEYAPRRWQHVVAVKDGSRMRLYLDGELSHEAVDESTTPPELQFVMGQLYAATVHRFFVGYVDEVAVYDRPLTEQEITRHYRLLRPAAEPRVETTSRSSAEAFQCGRLRLGDTRDTAAVWRAPPPEVVY